jgi:hypothetical protein
MAEEKVSIDGEGEEKQKPASFLVQPPDYTPDLSAYEADPKIGNALSLLESMAVSGGMIVRGVRTSCYPHARMKSVTIEAGAKLADAKRQLSESSKAMKGKRKLLESFDDGNDAAGPGSPNNPEAEFLQILGGPFCFAGETKVRLLNGTERTIRELADEYAGKSFWVYSINAAGRIEPGLAHSAARTGVQTPVVKVTLDNGESVRCTPGHRFMLRDGSYRKASDLRPDDSLMPLYTKVSGKGLAGYEMLYQPGENRWRYTHASFVGPIKRGQVRHHVDVNPRNNEPTNLVVMSKSEHQSLHMKLAGSWWNDPAKRRGAVEKMRAKAIGRVRSEDDKKKQGATRTANNGTTWISWNTGLHGWMSEAHKASIRATAPAATANANRIRVWTDEMRAKVSASVARYHAEHPEYAEGAKRALDRGRATRFGKPTILNHRVVSVVPDGVDDVYDFTVEPNHNFALSAGVFVHNSKQLYLADYLNMHAKCWWEVTHNPVARQLVDLQTDYIIGRGVKFQAESVAFQTVWDEFERRDHWQKRLRQHVRDESWQGEAMLRKYANGRGQLTLRPIDPSTMWEKIAYPDDIERVAGYWQNFNGAYNIVTMDGVPFQTYTVDFVPADDIIHSLRNISSGEKRGRSDLFPGLGWFKRLRDFTAAVVLSGQYAFAYVFDVEIDGDASDIEAVRQNPNFAKVPKPGSSWLHNKAVQITPMSSQIGTGLSATREVTTMLLRFAAASMGIPLEYLGVTEGGTKASAIMRASPFAKRIESLQRHTEETCHAVKMAVYETAVAGGVLSKTESSDGEFTFPEPAPEDVDARLRRLDYLWRSGRITHKRSSIASVAEANINRYDYDKELADIKTEIEAGVDQVVQQINQRAAAMASAEDLPDSTGRMSPGDRSNAKDDSSSLK